MTAQAKNSRKLVKAREVTRMHKNGEKGPAKTTPKHEKRWTYRSNPEMQKRLAEMLKTTRAEKKSVLEKLNDKKAKLESSQAAAD